jgi:hypothetical protein
VRGAKTNIWTLVLAVAFALVVSGLDLLPRLESVPWYAFFVIPVIWVALWSAEDDVLPIIAVAVIATSLAMLRSHVSVGIWAPAPIVDRLIVASIIWLTVVLAILRKRARRTFKWITLAGRQWEPDNPGNPKNQKAQTNETSKKGPTPNKPVA